MGPGTGCVDTGAGTNLSYTGGTIGAGVVGDIKNLTSGGDLVNQFMVFPAGSPVLNFKLSAFGPGSPNLVCAGLTIGQSCSAAPNSPFILTVLVGGLTPTTSVALAATGVVVDSTGAAYWNGAFTTQVNLSPLAIQIAIGQGGSVTSTTSGQFSLSTVPEPGTLSMLLFGAGLVGFGLIRRRKA